MGEVFRIHGNIIVYIHTKDHLPPHVHIYYPSVLNYEATAKVLLKDFHCVVNEGFKLSEMNYIVQCLRENKEFITDAWRKIHG